MSGFWRNKSNSSASATIKIVSIICFLVLVWPTFLHASQSAIDAGRGWLLRSENVGVDGAWRSARDPGGIRSTSRALQALGNLAPVTSRPWLLAQTPNTLEETWDAAQAFREDLPTAFLVPLDRQRTEAGKWSSSADGSAGVYHTSLGLLSLAFGNRGAGSDRIPGVSYLLAHQLTDGSWPTAIEGQETAVVTAAASVALTLTDPATAALSIAHGRTWLLDQQHTDGGWGVEGSIIATTAEVLAALRWLGCPVAAETSAVAYLVSAQRQDGSWEGDPWTTALAISALLPAGLPDLAFAVGSPTSLSEVVPGDRWELVADVVNLGTFLASPVKLRLSLKDGAAQEVFFQELALTPIGPGQSARAVFTVNTTQLAGMYSWSVTIDPTALVNEGNEENNLAVGTLSVNGSRNLVIVPQSLAVYTWDGLLQLNPSNLPVGTMVQVRALVRCDGSGLGQPVSPEPVNNFETLPVDI